MFLRLLCAQKEEIYLNIIMDYMPDTVAKVQKVFTKRKQKMPLILTKLYIYQTLRALNYIHTVGYMHRDIKPENLLVDTRTHVVKVCDFGSAKRYEEG